MSAIIIDQTNVIITCNVTVLYINIAHLLCLQCIAKTFIRKTDLLLTAHKILEILKVLLTCNNLGYNGLHYLQMQGVSMGTKCAPTYMYANLVLTVIEDTFLSQMELKPKCQLRFIDNIFLVYLHRVLEFNKLVDQFNCSHDNLKLTSDWSYTELPFLELPHVQICQSALCQKGFKSQTIRVCGNCTNINDYDHSHLSPQEYLRIPQI